MSQRIAALIEAAVFALAATLALWVIVRIVGNGLRRFDAEWDFLAYHLPFGIKIFAGDLISIHPQFEELFRGAPLLVHAAIGAAWALHPLLTINATHMIGAFAFICALPIAFLAVGRQVIVFVLLALASPLVLIHTMSGYIDLPSNVFLFLVLISISQIQTNAARPGAWVAFGLVCIAATAASKYTVMPLALGAALVFGFVVFRGPDFAFRTKIVVAVLAVVAASSWGVRNTILFHNPIYPLKAPIVGHLLPHTWPLPSSAHDRPPEFVDVPQPFVTIASIFEMDAPQGGDRLVRYTVDQVGNGPGTTGFRMGGFWLPAITAGLGLLAFGLWRRYLQPKELMPLVALVVMTLFLPQSHELRYVLYIPLALAFFVALVLRRAKQAWERASATLVVLALAIGSWSINWVHLNKVALPLAQVASMMGVDLATLPRASVYCGRNMGRGLVFLAGPTLRENRVIWTGPGKDCPVSGFELVGKEAF